MRDIDGGKRIWLGGKDWQANISEREGSLFSFQLLSHTCWRKEEHWEDTLVGEKRSTRKSHLLEKRGALGWFNSMKSGRQKNFSSGVGAKRLSVLIFPLLDDRFLLSLGHLHIANSDYSGNWNILRNEFALKFWSYTSIHGESGKKKPSYLYI